MIKENKQLLVIIHLSQFLDFITGIGGFVVPLIIWLLKKDEIYELDYHGKTILNFRISMFIYTLICIPFVFLFGVGILGFIACFAFSLGPVMWVLLSELYPLKYRGLAIGVIAFVNSLISSLVQLVFPWELSTLGNSLTFFIFGMIALIGFFIMLKIVPETRGKSLEELEKEFVTN